MQTLTALIVDDEPAARRDLEQVLASIDGVRVTAHAGDAATARQLATRHQPDLIFLDINLPGGDGFTALEGLDANRNCVIFTTAYAQFALRAFEVGAADYLLKPVEEERCRRAIARAREILHGPAGDTPGEGTLEIEQRGVRRLIPVGTIRAIAADGNYLEITHDHGRGLIRRTLEGLLAELAPAPFIRLNRHHAVRATDVEIIHGHSRDLRLTLRDGSQWPVSRRRAPEVLAELRRHHAGRPPAP